MIQTLGGIFLNTGPGDGWKGRSVNKPIQAMLNFQISLKQHKLLNQIPVFYVTSQFVQYPVTREENDTHL